MFQKRCDDDDFSAMAHRRHSHFVIDSMGISAWSHPVDFFQTEKEKKK